jgi:hypothetical protein
LSLQGESNVGSLSFTQCSFLVGAAAGRVARALKQNATLTTIKLRGCFSEEFYDTFTAALLVNTTLTNLALDIPHDHLLAPVFLALGMNKALKKLTMHDYFSSRGVPLYTASLRDGLEKNSTLEMLHIRCSNTDNITNTEDISVPLLVSTLLPFLHVNTTVKSLKVEFSRGSNGPRIATTCLAIVAALQRDSSLENSEICSHDGGIAPDAYLIGLESVQMNTTLMKLCLNPILASVGNGEMHQAVSLVKKNYSLAVLDEGITERDETGELHAILRLNQAGRRYLIDDAGSIAKGVEVLIDVRDDLGCLFYHLLENPMLCDIEHQYEQSGLPTAKGGSHGTKRVRLPH